VCTIETTSKRTTILLDPEDQQALQDLKTLQRTTDMEAIRRSIRIARQLIAWQKAGGDIVLEKGKDRTRLMFMA
jgi:hypothetical protein